MENMMNELVTVQNNQVVVDSRSVAEHFEKAHKHILCSVVKGTCGELTVKSGKF